MSEYNENPEEDERKIGVGGSVGCLTMILIGFVVMVGSVILAYIVFYMNGPQD